MRLGAVRRHWERLGRRDPRWAVLTDPDKRGGGWNLEQFLLSGADERRRIHPVINWWLGGPFAPKMEMHCLPRSEVLTLVAGQGVRLVDSSEELVTGGFQSCRYWVYKDRS